MTTLEEKIANLEYVIYEDYHLEQYWRRYYTPSEVNDFYRRANEELKALYRQQESENEDGKG